MMCLFPLITIGLLLAQSPTATSSPIDREEVRQATKRTWESIQTLDFECVEHNDDGRAEPGESAPRFSAHYIAPNNWSTTVSGRTREGVVFFTEKRQSRGREYDIDYDPDDLSRILMLTKRVLATDPITYAGFPFPVMTLLMPGNQPIHRMIESGAELEWESADELRRVVVRSSFRGNPLVCRLDPAHGWLADQVTLGREGFYTLNVIRFGRVNGMWFPMEGVVERNAREGTPDGRFIVTKVGLNTTIDPGLFQMPEPQPGTVIDDQIADESYVFGENLADPARNETILSEQGRILVAEPARFWGIRNLVILLCSMGMIVVGGVLFARRWFS